MSGSNFELENDMDFESGSLLAESNQVLQEFSNDSKELQKEVQYFEYKNRSHNGEYFIFSYNAITGESIDDIKQRYVDQYGGDISGILITNESGNEINGIEIKNYSKIYIKAKISDNPHPIEFTPSIFPTGEYIGYFIEIKTRGWNPNNLRQMFQDQNDVVIGKDDFNFIQVEPNIQDNEIYDDYKEFHPGDKIVMNVKRQGAKQNNSPVLDEVDNNDSTDGDSLKDNSIEETHTNESSIEQDEVDKYAEIIKNQTGRIAYGNKNNKEITITIDDGNYETATAQILEILSKRGIKVTFFIIGNNIRLYKNLWKTAIEQGHQICCHTYSHIYLSDKTPYTSLGSKKQKWIGDVKRLLGDEYYENLGKKCTSGNFPSIIDSDLLLETEILMWEQEVKINLGEDYLARMKKNYPFFRFPGGHGILASTQEVKKKNVGVLKKMGYLSIGWSTDFVENKRALTASEVASKSIPNGSIPLFHCKPEDVERISAYIKNEDNRGMTALPLSDILVLGNK